MLTILMTIGLVVPLQAQNTILFNAKDQQVVELIERYSKASGQRFLVDSNVAGTVSVFNPEPLPLEEAFHQLSVALAVNGLAISKRDDLYVVRSARNVQRDLIEVTSELPNLKPERMVTWVYQMKHANAENINRDIRILLSKDGEMVAHVASNRLIISDFVSNIHRVAKILEATDVKALRALPTGPRKAVHKTNKAEDN